MGQIRLLVRAPSVQLLLLSPSSSSLATPSASRPQLLQQIGQLAGLCFAAFHCEPRVGQIATSCAPTKALKLSTYY